MAAPAPENLKLSVAASFLPLALRELAVEFNRLRALPSSPTRTQACDMLVAKVLTLCMDMQSSAVLVDTVVNDSLRASQGEIVVALLFMRQACTTNRGPSEERWRMVLHLLENSALFIQNIARGVVQEVAVHKLVPVAALQDTITVVQRSGGMKDFDAPVRQVWFDTVMPLLHRFRSSTSSREAGTVRDLTRVLASISAAAPPQIPQPIPAMGASGVRRADERTPSPVQRSLIGASRASQRGVVISGLSSSLGTAGEGATPPPLPSTPPPATKPSSLPMHNPMSNAASSPLAVNIFAQHTTTDSNSSILSNNTSPSPRGSTRSDASGSPIFNSDPPPIAQPHIASFSPPNSPPRSNPVLSDPAVLSEARTDVTAESAYMFGKQLGKGSFATVYEGMHKQSRTPVALKVIPKLKIGSPEAVQMLRNEVSSLLRLNHPHIVRLFDVFEDSNKFTLVLELLRGREMFDRIIERGRYSEQDASAAMRQVFEAVGYLHQNKIAHRDLKPENLLSVERHGRELIKLADFGLARSFGETNGMSTACGSPLYVAPEVLFGNVYGPAVDLWACGVILYLLLSGTSPFPNGPDVQRLFRSIQTNSWQFGPEWNNVSESAKDLVRMLMNPEPRTRYTAGQALQHPWISRSTALPSAPLNSAYAALSRSRLVISQPGWTP